MIKLVQLSQYYDIVCSIALLYSLFFSSDIKGEYQEVQKLVDEDFIEILQGAISAISEKQICPEKTVSNMKQLLECIHESNPEYENEIKEMKAILNSINNFSYDAYLDEFYIRQNNLDEFKNNSAHVWDLKDLEDSIKFDYFVIATLGTNQEDYQKYLEQFILNKNYIYSVRKIITDYSQLLKRKDFYKRIESVLMNNLELIKQYNMDALKKYVEQNYKTIPEQLSFLELEQFKIETQNTLKQLQKFNEIQFNFGRVKEYYNLSKFENYIYNGGKINPEMVNIELIYNEILEHRLLFSRLNSSQKNRLINLLASKREEQAKENLQEYNEYLVAANGIEERTEVESFLLKKCEPEDFENLDALVFDKEFNLGTYPNYFPHSIRKIIQECPGLFMADGVSEKTINELEKYNNRVAKKQIKILKRKV